jgi:hypothetical protein
MTIGGCDLYSGENKKIVHRHSVQSHPAFLEQVIDRVACIVISDSNAMQTFGARGCNHVFRAGDTVPGKKRMRMQIDIKWHGSNRGEVDVLQGLQSQKERGD